MEISPLLGTRLGLVRACRLARRPGLGGARLLGLGHRTLLGQVLTHCALDLLGGSIRAWRLLLGLGQDPCDILRTYRVACDWVIEQLISRMSHHHIIIIL